MRTRWGRQVEDLQSWFDIACGPLCSDTQEVIGYEVSSHYDEAYDAAVESGMEPEDANEAALVSLGDPYKARDGFRQVHLTKNEMRRLYPSRSVQVFCLLCMVLGLWPILPSSEELFPLAVGSWLFVFMTCSVGRWAIRGRQPFMLIVGFYSLFGAAFTILAIRESAPLFIYCLVLAIVACLEEDMRLQMKLRRIAQPTC